MASLLIGAAVTVAFRRWAKRIRPAPLRSSNSTICGAMTSMGLRKPGQLYIVLFVLAAASGGYWTRSTFDSVQFQTSNDSFQRVKMILANRCLACHTGPHGARLDWADESAFIASGLVKAGDPDRSPLVTRLQNYKGPTLSLRNMPLMANLPDHEYRVIEAWVKNLEVRGVRSELGFKDTNCSQIEAQHSIRLNFRQLDITLRKLFGDDIVHLNEDLMARLSTDMLEATPINPQNLISSSFLGTFQQLTWSIAHEFMERSVLFRESFKSCLQTSSNLESCLDPYLQGMAQRIYRRPLRSSEIESSIRVFERFPDGLQGLKAVIAFHLQSPSFLYIQPADHQSEQASFSLASRISYSLTDSPPDTELWSMAQSDKLKSSEGVQYAIEQQLKKPEAKTKLADLIYFWLDLKRRFRIDYLPRNLIDGFDAEQLSLASYEEIKKFVYHVVVEERSPFSELFLNPKIFTQDVQLRSIYRKNFKQDQGVSKGEIAAAGLLFRLPFLFNEGLTTSLI
jgi:hypothetical protein